MKHETDVQTTVAWPWRLSAFLRDCRAAAPELEADQIREGHRLFGALVESSRLRHSFPDGPTIERLIAAGAHESAAIAIVGRDRPFLLSRGAGGVCFATLVAAGTSREVTAEGLTPALALLGAMAILLADSCQPAVRSLRERLSDQLLRAMTPSRASASGTR
jgi:hypothetical protein